MFPAFSVYPATNPSTHIRTVAEPLDTEVIASIGTVATKAIEPDIDTPAHISHIELPNEVWSEVARFSSRTDILNLRTTCRMLKAEVDTAITQLTLRGHECLNDFIRTRGFEAVKVLGLEGIHSTGLQEFASHLAAHPRDDLTICIADSCYGGLEHALTALSIVPLAGLRLHADLDNRLLEKLCVCAFPIELIGSFTSQELATASRIASLSRLTLHSATFDDGAAKWFSSLSALRSLSIQACEQFTSRGVESVASIGTLQALSIQEAFHLAAPVDAAAAAALAANPCLESLDFHTSAQPFSQESLLALSHSQSLQRVALAIGPGLHHLANIASLKGIKLSGRCAERHAIDFLSASCIANMSHLHAINIAGACFEGEGLCFLLGNSSVRDCHLADMPITPDAVQALLSNVNVRALTLVNAALTSEDKAALSHHPTLEHLSIDYVPHASHGRSVR